MGYDGLDKYVGNYHGDSVPINNYVMTSSPLRNGIYSFSILDITPPHHYQCPMISIAVSDQNQYKFLYSYSLIGDHLITVYVHDEYLFLKIIGGDKVKSTASLIGTDLFSIRICNLVLTNINCSFCIHNHVQ